MINLNLHNKKESINNKDVHLTFREKECAHYLLLGLTAKEMGKVLGVSHRTIEGHLTNLKKKLECNKSAALIVKLLSLGSE